MATRQQKKDAEHRYERDERVPVRLRMNFAASRGWDKMVVPGMYVTTAGAALMGVAQHRSTGAQIDQIAETKDAVPYGIADLGERLHAVPASGAATYVETDLRNAAIHVLSKGPDDLRNVKLIFAAHSNKVTIESKAETFQRQVEPVQLATAFKENLATRQQDYQEAQNAVDGVSAFLALGLGFFAWRAKVLRDQRIQIALDRYGIK